MGLQKNDSKSLQAILVDSEACSTDIAKSHSGSAAAAYDAASDEATGTH